MNAVQHHSELSQLARSSLHVVDDSILLFVQSYVDVPGQHVELGIEERAAVAVPRSVHGIYEWLNLLSERRKSKHDEVEPFAGVVVDANDTTSLLTSVLAHAREQHFVRHLEKNHIGKNSINHVVCSGGLLQKKKDFLVTCWGWWGKNQHTR